MEIVIATVSKIAEYTVEPIGQQMGYLFFYNNNVTKLKNQVEKLGDEKQRMQQSVGEAKRNGNEIFEDVKKWLINVDGTTVEAEKLADDASRAKPSCSNRLCLNLKSWHQLSRKSKKMAQVVSTIVGEGSLLVERGVSYCAPPQGIGLATESIKGYEVFGSRKSTLSGVMKALKSDKVNKIGVYGMGGVGKTMLVKEVARQAKQLKLFDKVVMAVVSQTPNMKEIQEKIAHVLDLKFDTESTISVRADKLHERLKTEKTILVIIDDIWEELDLEAIGISFGDDQKGCKILFTSRSKEVLCNDMDSQKVFSLGVLSNDEARYLYEKIVGGLPEDTDFRFVVDEIVKECAGLPIAITTITNALKNRSLPVWKDAVHQQRTSNPTNIKGVPEKVYSSIELSYNYLRSGEAKSLFLLCSLFKEDSNIKVEFLLRYGMGLDLFQGVYHLEDVRNRVHTLVENLKSSCLLLDGDKDDTIKMHDVIRDVAIHIAGKAKDMFIVENALKLQELSNQKKLKDLTALSMFYTDEDVCELLERLECPQLKLFLLSSDHFSLQHPFLEGMKELQVLHLIGMQSQFLSSSLSFLQNLQILCLNGFELKNIASIGELKNLKVLDLSSSDIKELPKEIRQLTNLQSLDLSNCSKLEIIPANVLSNLKRLEELDMEDSFSRWDVERESTERSIAKVTELNQLSHLTTLKVHIPNVKFMPKAVIFEKLVRYDIMIGDSWGWGSTYKSSRILSLKLNASLQSEYLDAVKKLKSCEELYLDKLKGVENILYKLNSDGFPCLKHLVVQENDEIQYIVNSTGLQCGVVFPVLESFSLYHMINLEKICHGQLVVGSFHNLRIVKVGDCDNLKFVFSSSMAGCFQQLQEMEVTNCKGMSAIVAMEREDKTEINDGTKDMMEFTQLHSLTLEDLPNLMCFCSDVDSNVLLNEKVLFPNLEKLVLVAINNVEKIWHDKLSLMSSCFQNLTTLTVKGYDRLKYLLSSSMMRSLMQLKDLRICECKVMEEILAAEESDEEKRADSILFPKLESLYLSKLPKLMRFCFENLIDFPSLKALEIIECPELKTFVSNSLSTNLTVNKELEEMNNFATQSLFNEKVLVPNLLKMVINGMDNLRIWHNKLAPDSFCKLNEMKVEACPNLMNIFPSNIQRRLQSLEALKVTNCELLEDVFEIGGTNVIETGDVVATQLRSLYLENLPKLERVWNMNLQGISLLTFQNLHTVTVGKCSSLKSLFPASVAKQLLQLESLRIWDSGVENIVAKEEGLETQPNKFVFPLLNLLRLQRLPELKSFYLGKHTSEWPSLKHLEIENCGKVKIFASDSLTFQETRGVGHHGVPFEQHLFLIEKVSFPELEELTLIGHFAVIEICNGHIPIEFFSKLKVLRLCTFDDKSLVFQDRFLQRLHNLETLRVEYSNFGEIFLYEELGEEKHGVTQSQTRVKNFFLCRLPELVHLQKVDSQTHPFFQNLETLEVVHCDKLKNLVPSSISFQNLTLMLITNCKNITEIVAKKGGEAGDDEILFTQLKTLGLYVLDSLTSFYIGNCNIKFPSLERVIVKACPKLKIFSHGILSTPKLQRVDLDKICRNSMMEYPGKVVVTPTEELGEVDLNATVERFWEDYFNKSEEQSFTNQKVEISRDDKEHDMDNESETQDHV